MKEEDMLHNATDYESWKSARFEELLRFGKVGCGIVSGVKYIVKRPDIDELIKNPDGSNTQNRKYAINDKSQLSDNAVNALNIDNRDYDKLVVKYSETHFAVITYFLTTIGKELKILIKSDLTYEEIFSQQDADAFFILIEKNVLAIKNPKIIIMRMGNFVSQKKLTAMLIIQQRLS